MAGEAWPIDVSSGAPSYTAAESRQIDSTLFRNGTADAFGVRGGRRPGAGMVVTASALAWSVTAGAFVAYPRFNATQGPYRVTFPATEAGAYNAPHASFSRRDILSVVIDDNAVDASVARQARIVYTAGTASGSPVSPAVPARGTLLATLVVPPAGSPTVIMGPRAVAAGGIIPVADLTELAALSASENEYAGVDSNDNLYRSSGGGWELARAGLPASGDTSAWAGTGLSAYGGQPLRVIGGLNIAVATNSFGYGSLTFGETVAGVKSVTPASISTGTFDVTIHVSAVRSTGFDCQVFNFGSLVVSSGVGIQWTALVW